MEKDLILIVDDIEINRVILQEILQDDYDIVQAENGFEAIETVMGSKREISLILLDIMMPEMDGYEVLDVLRLSGHLERTPVIVITANAGDANEIKCLTAGASDFVGKPFHPEIVKCRVKAQVELKNHRLHLEDLVKQGVHKVNIIRDAVVDFMATIIEHRHIESGDHVKRTRLMAEQLLNQAAKSKRMSDEINHVSIPTIVRAIPLHDIGKISIPDNILLKPGKLTYDEFEIMKQHTVLGAELVEGIKGIEEPKYLEYCRDVCLYHHECWDGSGYPSGLKEKEIPFAARVMAIIDVYDALVNKRVYKPAFSQSVALNIIKEGSGTQFDPVLTEIFIENADSYRQWAEELEDEEL